MIVQYLGKNLITNISIVWIRKECSLSVKRSDYVLSWGEPLEMHGSEKVCSL